MIFGWGGGPDVLAVSCTCPVIAFTDTLAVLDPPLDDVAANVWVAVDAGALAGVDAFSPCPGTGFPPAEPPLEIPAGILGRADDAPVATAGGDGVCAGGIAGAGTVANGLAGAVAAGLVGATGVALLVDAAPVDAAIDVAGVLGPAAGGDGAKIPTPSDSRKKAPGRAPRMPHFRELRREMARTHQRPYAHHQPINHQ